MQACGLLLWRQLHSCLVMHGSVFQRLWGCIRGTVHCVVLVAHCMPVVASKSQLWAAGGCFWLDLTHCT
jgi:hypothetical protein